MALAEDRLEKIVRDMDLSTMCSLKAEYDTKKQPLVYYPTSACKIRRSLSTLFPGYHHAFVHCLVNCGVAKRRNRQNGTTAPAIPDKKRLVENPCHRGLEANAPA